jgi:hypothetical protein
MPASHSIERSAGMEPRDHFRTGRRLEVAPLASLYERLMGDDWVQLAAPVRLLHQAHDSLQARGHLRVDRGQHLLARLLARILRLPSQSAHVDTTLVVIAGGDGERWLRTFDGRALDTRQFEAERSELVERFGVLQLRFRLERAGESLVYIQRGAALVIGPMRIPLPDAWTPLVEAREDPAGPSTFDLHVRVTVPAVGMLIAYHGLVEVETAPS